MTDREKKLEAFIIDLRDNAERNADFAWDDAREANVMGDKIEEARAMRSQKIWAQVESMCIEALKESDE